jgi:DNA-binding transcriptional regulator YiaG
MSSKYKNNPYAAKYDDMYEMAKKNIAEFEDFGGGRLGGVEKEADFDQNKISRTLNFFDMFVGLAVERLHPAINDAFAAAFVGNRGTGKSTDCNVFCHAVNSRLEEVRLDAAWRKEMPDKSKRWSEIQNHMEDFRKKSFSVENVFFDAKDVVKALKTKGKEAISFEELGVSMYSRDFMKKGNKDINKVMQMFRYRNLIITMNFQGMTHIDNHARQQMDVIMWCRSKIFHDENGSPFTQKLINPNYVFTSPFSDPFIRPWTFMSAGKANYDPIGWIPMPAEKDLRERYGVTDEFMRDYQNAKEEYFDKIGAEEENAENAEGEAVPKLTKQVIQKYEKQGALNVGMVDILSNEFGMSQADIAKRLNINRKTFNSYLMSSDISGLTT